MDLGLGLWLVMVWVRIKVGKSWGVEVGIRVGGSWGWI